MYIVWFAQDCDSAVTNDVTPQAPLLPPFAFCPLIDFNNPRFEEFFLFSHDQSLPVKDYHYLPYLDLSIYGWCGRVPR